MVATKVPVTVRALTQRINRHLMKQEEVLKKARARAIRAEFGEYYVVNWRSNLVQQWHVDPVALAQELGLLHAWETIRTEEE